MMAADAISLKEAERRAFTSTFQHGLWDIFLGCAVSMLAIAPFLSPSLGDFWASAVFLPVYAVLYGVLLWVRAKVVRPRLGTVRFAHARRKRLVGFNLVMLVLNLVAFVAGLVAWLSPVETGWSIPIRFSLIVLIMLCTAAWFLDLPRLYVYGLLLALSPIAGEWLWRHAGVPHHGFPVTFGAAAAVIIATGVVLFVRVLRLPTIDPEKES